MKHILNLIIPAWIGFMSSTAEATSTLLPAIHQQSQDTLFQDSTVRIDHTGNTIASRFSPPNGFNRITVKDSSFGHFLRNLPLKPHGSQVNYYDGSIKRQSGVYCAVIDLPIGKRDLHQCADAIMRLRADFLRSTGRFDEIHFRFNTGFEARYDKWMNGYRIHFNGTDFYWTKDTEPSNSDHTYWKYLEYVFSFAGTYSLAQELPSVNEANMQIGDVFLWGGHPGHGVIVVDMAKHTETGEVIFMLAQSYMPAQEIQLLINPTNESISPWYSLDFGDYLETPNGNLKNGTSNAFNHE